MGAGGCRQKGAPREKVGQGGGRWDVRWAGNGTPSGVGEGERYDPWRLTGAGCQVSGCGEQNGTARGSGDSTARTATWGHMGETGARLAYTGQSRPLPSPS